MTYDITLDCFFAQRRHRPPQALLQTYHQRMGMDILDSLAQRLERGYEKLYRWVQREGRELEAVPEVKTTFVTALRLLRQMPV